MTEATERVPLVTIGMPVYNGARHLEGAIRSLLAQTEPDFVLHISDNCSTDATPGICSRLAAEDSRIRYERQPSNIGATHNFELLARRAKSPFFMWAAHDDVRPPNYLQVALALLMKSPGAVGCALGVDIVDESEQLLRRVPHPTRLASRSPIARVRAVFRQGHYAVYGLFPQDVIASNLPVPDEYGGDVIFVHRIALSGQFVVASEPALKYRYSTKHLEVKRAGQDGHLYDDAARRRRMHQAMVADARRASIPLVQRAMVLAYIAYVDAHDWRRLIHADWRVAIAEGHRLKALALSIPLAILSPIALIRRVRLLVGHRRG